MDKATITSEVTTDVLAILHAIAAREGLTPEQFAGNAIRLAVEDETALLVAIKEGREQIARGEGLTHEGLVEQIHHWKRDLRHAA